MTTDQPAQQLPTERVYPPDLDLDAITKRDDEALPLLQLTLADLQAYTREPTEEVMAMLRALQDRHALLTELHMTRRDRDSARANVLAVAGLVPRWLGRFTGEGEGSEFNRGLAAAAQTLAEVLQRQMLRD